MRHRRLLLVVISLVAFGLAPAAAASAADGCDAPQGTAAVDQYCELLPTADGSIDVSRRPSRPLASVLPAWIVRKLQKAGALGMALLALPAPVDALPPGSPAAVARHRAVASKIDGLLPGPGASAGSVITAAATGHGLYGGLGWVFVLTLVALSCVSLWGSVFRVSAR